MKVANALIVGSGGREHALEWKIQQSDSVKKVFCAPGNGGTGSSVPIDPLDFEALSDFAERNDCFTIVGPELPLARGIADFFQRRDLPVYGPTSSAASAESSKVWAKRFMERHSIPTASFEVFDDPQNTVDYVDQKGAPIVLKADGLAAGKGAIVCDSVKEARDAVDLIMVNREFGDAGSRVVVEEYLSGEEASFMGIVDTDSRHFIALASSQDHKAIYEGDKGPNTGGMGAYSPAPVMTTEVTEEVRGRIIDRFVDGMRADGVAFKGTLYVGLMIVDGKPYVLEFNVRFGDPELQPVVVRLQEDLFPYLLGCQEGGLDEMEDPSWSEKAAVCVVMASEGYPGEYDKSKVIHGLDNASAMEDVFVFHAGTTRDRGDVLTNGGRVVGVTALGHGVDAAIQRVYKAVDQISWRGEYHRRDIGAKALKHVGTD